MCEHNNIKFHNTYEEHILVECVEVCKDCGKKIGVWAYGNYESYLDYEGEED